MTRFRVDGKNSAEEKLMLKKWECQNSFLLPEGEGRINEEGVVLELQSQEGGRRLYLSADAGRSQGANVVVETQWTFTVILSIFSV